MRIKNIILLLAMFVTSQISALAQKNVGTMLKTCLSDVKQNGSVNSHVRQGEFLVKFDEFTVNKGNNSKTNKFILILRDEKNNVLSLQTNHFYDNYDKKEAEIIRVGNNQNDLIYIAKENVVKDGVSVDEWYYHNGNSTEGPFEKIVEVLPDGLIVKNYGAYYYHEYGTDALPVEKKYVIVEKEKYDRNVVEYQVNGKTFSFKPHNKVAYYKSYNGQYYLIYHDSAMENSLLVVDGIGYEFDGGARPIFSFSHDGKHWIAATKNFVMVDGVVVNNKNMNTTNVFIKNDGTYAYLVEGKNFSDKIYLNGKLLVEGVDVKKIAIDDKERLYYIIENEKSYFKCLDFDVVSMESEMEGYYYPKLATVKHEFTVKSNDGLHYFSFNYDSKIIEIDGDKYERNSVPHYANWNEETKTFEWNVVQDGKLYVYMYKVD